MSGQCVFCRIIRGEIPSEKVYEDERALAFLDIHPSTPGHTLVIPKTHVSRIEDLSEEDASALFRVLHRLVGRIQSAVGAPASTIGINNGQESGQEVPHIHIHVIPRSRSDRGGIIQGIARPQRHIGREELSQIAERIREHTADLS
ncbi:MAG: HIT family protein [Candidatus Bathyarchaeota archaeon]|nr:MAG: HIT family protein [Candidatus Bathyarchaeota archaeon]